MSLIVGEYYYFLTAEEYTELQKIYQGGDLIDDFIEGPDGFFYAPATAIDDDESDFLLESEMGGWTYYSKSTQPGINM